MTANIFGMDEKILNLADTAQGKCHDAFKRIDEITEYNQQKVLKAFVNNRISERHLVETTGYGYGDAGRDALDKTFADAYGAESALVRHNFTCGTHTLGVGLFGVLRPGETMLCVTGEPYDTIHSVIGLTGNGTGSLMDYGIKYEQLELNKNGNPDIPAIKKAVSEKFYKLVYVQRSRGYALRPTVSVDIIGKIADAVHGISKDTIVFVDNCYGEFTEKQEPICVGADLMAGSLIKNAGGGIARTGGYIMGRADLVKLCSYRATVPGLGAEVGASIGQNRNMFMGLFSAPHVTGEAVKTAVFASALFELLGFKVSPSFNEPRYDIIQFVELGSGQALKAFCQGVQSGAPIDSFVVPEPWDMPGYDNPVIMAAGSFISGASIEFSADGPMREPYAVWMQGGLNYHSAKAGILLAVQNMKDKGVLHV